MQEKRISTLCNQAAASRYQRKRCAYLYAQVDGKPRRLVCCLPVKRHFNSLFALVWNFNLSLACTQSIILHPPARTFFGPLSVIYY